MKKQLDTSGIANELKGASVFFVRDASKLPARARSPKPPTEQPQAATAGLSEKEKSTASVTQKKAGAADKASQRISTPAYKQASAPARYRASAIEAIRKVVRVVGKEVAFVRLTPAEKQRMGEVVYAYKRQSIKTSENELLRIGLAYLLDDYEDNGKESVLARVIAALNQ